MQYLIYLKEFEKKSEKNKIDNKKNKRMKIIYTRKNMYRIFICYIFNFDWCNKQAQYFLKYLYFRDPLFDFDDIQL